MSERPLSATLRPTLVDGLRRAPAMEGAHPGEAASVEKVGGDGSASNGWWVVNPAAKDIDNWTIWPYAMIPVALVGDSHAAQRTSDANSAQERRRFMAAIPGMGSWTLNAGRPRRTSGITRGLWRTGTGGSARRDCSHGSRRVGSRSTTLPLAAA